MEDDYSEYRHHGWGVAEVGKISGGSSGSRQDPVAGRGGVGDAPAAAAATEEEEGFTFAAVRSMGVCDGGVFSGGRIGGPVYPVFGRPRSPPLRQEVEVEEDRDTATVRVPLGQLLLQERRRFPSSGQQPDDEDDEDGDELDGVPAETYCLWSPGGSTSPAAAASSPASPARCQKSGSTGSVLRWRQRLIGRSHSDGKEKFVFLNTAAASPSSPAPPKGSPGRGWSYYGRGGGSGSGRGSRRRTPTTTPPSFLPYKQDLVGLFANAGAFRRSYHPF